MGILIRKTAEVCSSSLHPLITDSTKEFENVVFKKYI